MAAKAERPILDGRSPSRDPDAYGFASGSTAGKRGPLPAQNVAFPSHSEIMDRREIARRRVEEKQLKECTFSPAINPRSRKLVAESKRWSKTPNAKRKDAESSNCPASCPAGRSLSRTQAGEGSEEDGVKRKMNFEESMRKPFSSRNPNLSTPHRRFAPDKPRWNTDARVSWIPADSVSPHVTPRKEVWTMDENGNHVLLQERQSIAEPSIQPISAVATSLKPLSLVLPPPAPNAEPAIPIESQKSPQICSDAAATSTPQAQDGENKIRWEVINENSSMSVLREFVEQEGLSCKASSKRALYSKILEARQQASSSSSSPAIYACTTPQGHEEVGGTPESYEARGLKARAQVLRSPAARPRKSDGEDRGLWPADVGDSSRTKGGGVCAEAVQKEAEQRIRRLGIVQAEEEEQQQQQQQMEMATLMANVAGQDQQGGEEEEGEAESRVLAAVLQASSGVRAALSERAEVWRRVCKAWESAEGALAALRLATASKDLTVLARVVTQLAQRPAGLELEGLEQLLEEDALPTLLASAEEEHQVAAAVAAHSALAFFGELLETTPPLRQPCAGLAQRRNTLGVNIALEGRQLRVERCCLLLAALQPPLAQLRRLKARAAPLASACSASIRALLQARGAESSGAKCV